MKPAEWIGKFAGRRVALLGDLAADEFVHGTAARVSREAPVLVVREERRELRPGGAANAAANLRALGGAPIVVGWVGDDAPGRALLESLLRRGVDCGRIVTAHSRATTTKTRVLAGGENTVRQQVVRLDRVCREPLENGTERALLERLRQAVAEAGVLLVSDYGEGVLTPAILAEVNRLSVAEKIPVVVDSRYRIGDFRSVEALTPNEPELAAFAHEDAAGFDWRRAGERLLRETGARMVALKRGKNGMALIRPDGIREAPAFGSDEVADVTGAGDTVAAAFTLARAVGAPPEVALNLANTAGGIKVTKAGTAAVFADELRRALSETA